MFGAPTTNFGQQGHYFQPGENHFAPPPYGEGADCEKGTEGIFAGKATTATDDPDQRAQMLKDEAPFQERTLQSRKTERCLATLSAIGMGIASVLFIIPAVSSFGAVALGSLGGLIGGLIGGPLGLGIGGWVGIGVGGFAGFAVTAILTPYLMAKTYNLVLEASNGNHFERSNLADRIVTSYERRLGLQSSNCR